MASLNQLPATEPFERPTNIKRAKAKEAHKFRILDTPKLPVSRKQMRII